MSLVSEYSWVVFVIALLIGFYIWSKYLGDATIKVLGRNLTRRDMRNLAHVVGLALMVWGCSAYLFPEVKGFFFMFLGVFSMMGAGVWYYADKKNDIWILENTMQGEEMYNLKVLKKKTVGQSGIRLYRMPPHVYEAKTHEGDLSGLFWKKGRMVFTDLYDGQTFYHPEHPDLHNINFYQAMAFWLNFKKEYPRVAREMIKLTWLRDWDIADALQQLEAKSALALSEWRVQHPQPFDIAMTREQLFKKLKKERTLDLSAQETLRGKDDKINEKEKGSKLTMEDLEGLLEGEP